MGDIAPANDRIKKDIKTRLGKERIQICPRCGGTNGTRDASSLQCLQKLACTWQDNQTLGSNEFAVKFLLAIGQFANQRRIIPPPQRRDDDFILLAEACFEVPFWKEEIPFGGQEFPRPFMLGGGINDDSIPIKNDAPRAKLIHVHSSTMPPKRWIGIGEWPISAHPKIDLDEEQLLV